MKRTTLFLILVVLFFSTTASASIKMKPKLLTTEAIDAVWEKTDFISNLLPLQDQDKRYGQDEAAGRLRFFWGKARGIDIMMAISDMPKFMDQMVNIQVAINGQKKVLPSLPFINNYSLKLINDKVVIRCNFSVDTYGPHFYIVRNQNGDGYETSVVSAK